MANTSCNVYRFSRLLYGVRYGASATAGRCSPIPVPHRLQHLYSSLSTNLHTHGSHAKDIKRTVAAQVEIERLHTLRAKIEDVPGSMVETMTDELLSLGALSARSATCVGSTCNYTSADSLLPFKSHVTRRLILMNPLVQVQCGGVQDARCSRAGDLRGQQQGVGAVHSADAIFCIHRCGRNTGAVACAVRQRSSVEV